MNHTISFIHLTLYKFPNNFVFLQNVTHSNAPQFQYQNAEKINSWFRFKRKRLAAFLLSVVSVLWDNFLEEEETSKENLLYDVNFMELMVTNILPIYS